MLRELLQSIFYQTLSDSVMVFFVVKR